MYGETMGTNMTPMSSGIADNDTSMDDNSNSNWMQETQMAVSMPNQQETAQEEAKMAGDQQEARMETPASDWQEEAYQAAGRENREEDQQEAVMPENQQMQAPMPLFNQETQETAQALSGQAMPWEQTAVTNAMMQEYLGVRR